MEKKVIVIKVGPEEKKKFEVDKAKSGLETNRAFLYHLLELYESVSKKFGEEDIKKLIYIMRRGIHLEPRVVR